MLQALSRLVESFSVTHNEMALSRTSTRHHPASDFPRLTFDEEGFSVKFDLGNLLSPRCTSTFRVRCTTLDIFGAASPTVHIKPTAKPNPYSTTSCTSKPDHTSHPPGVHWPRSLRPKPHQPQVRTSDDDNAADVAKAQTAKGRPKGGEVLQF
jgi:hypothetical protein